MEVWPGEPSPTGSAAAAQGQVPRKGVFCHLGPLFFLRPGVEPFSCRRDKTVALVGGLTLEHWRRAGHHDHRGRTTVEDLVTLMVWHDDHLDQITHALEGRA